MPRFYKRNKKHRYKDIEDWKWFEDPYSSRQELGGIAMPNLPSYSPTAPVH